MTDTRQSARGRSRFSRLGAATYRHRILVVTLWAMAFLVSIPMLLRVEEPLKVGGFSSNRTEAARARLTVERELSGSASQLVVIFKSSDEPIGSPAMQQRIAVAVEPFRDHAHVIDIVLPTENAAQISDDGQTAYALVSVDLPAEEAQRLIPGFQRLIAPQ